MTSGKHASINRTARPSSAAPAASGTSTTSRRPSISTAEVSTYTHADPGRTFLISGPSGISVGLPRERRGGTGPSGPRRHDPPGERGKPTSSFLSEKWLLPRPGGVGRWSPCDFQIHPRRFLKDLISYEVMVICKRSLRILRDRSRGWRQGLNHWAPSRSNPVPAAIRSAFGRNQWREGGRKDLGIGSRKQATSRQRRRLWFESQLIDSTMLHRPHPAPSPQSAERRFGR